MRVSVCVCVCDTLFHTLFQTMDLQVCVCGSVCVCVCVCLLFPSFPIYVRKCFSWSRRCVCPTVFQGAAAGRYTLGTPREIFEFQFCECDSVNEIW